MHRKVTALFLCVCVCVCVCFHSRGNFVCFHVENKVRVATLGFSGFSKKPSLQKLWREKGYK